MKPASELLKTALAYGRRGWPVFPLHYIRDGHCTCGNADCTDAGKHPRTVNGLKDASRDPTVISKWWRAGSSNIGIATGIASGLLVLDVDVQDGGGDSLADLEHRYGPLPETIESLTGGGGRHIYLRYPLNAVVRNSAGKLGPWLDIRGDGGYVVAPPSLHSSGRRYEWEGAHHPDDMALADPPTWFVKFLAKPTESDPGSHYPQAWRQLSGPIPTGKRNVTLTSIAGWLRLYHPQDAVIAMLQSVNLARCQPPLEEEEVAGIIRSVFRYAQPGVNGHPRAAVPRYVREGQPDD